MIAKYEGRCPICVRKIKPGQEIVRLDKALMLTHRSGREKFFDFAHAECREKLYGNPTARMVAERIGR